MGSPAPAASRIRFDIDEEPARKVVSMPGPYDVVVVGAGNAALCAALSACEQGAKVAVLAQLKAYIEEVRSALSTPAIEE